MGGDDPRTPGADLEPPGHRGHVDVRSSPEGFEIDLNDFRTA